MSLLAAPLASPLYEGTSGTSSEVPSRFDLAIDGLVWMLDEKFMGEDTQMKRGSVALYKPQSDQSGQVSEASLNPEDLARAAQESWHRGAGQTYLDRPDSDPYRFRSSKGVDVLSDRWKAPMLPATERFLQSANTNLHLAPTSTRLYFLDGTAVKYDDDLSGAPSSMTGAPGTTWATIATNGYDVWAADGANIYHWVRGDTAVGAAWSAADCDLLVWVRGKGRLMGAHDDAVFNITTAAASYTDIGPSTISADFRWVGFAEGPSCIYGAGYEGDKSNIFRWGIKTDGTGLDVAVPALVDGLPDGEIVRSIYSYGGVVVIGTDDGFRLAIPANTAGDLKVGPLVELDVAVRCFEGQRSHIFGGWTNFDGTSTGLVRINPAQLLDDDLVPAYASDLMATAQGTVLSICTFLGKRVFTVSGAGVYVESVNLTTDAWLRTGLITHGLPDPKVGMHLIVNHEQLEGTVSASVATNGGTFQDIGSSSSQGETTRVLNVGQSKGDTFEVELVPARSSTDTTAGPVLTRLTFESNPAPGRGEMFWVYLLNFDEVKDRNNNTFRMDTYARYRAVADMVNDGEQVTFQDGGGSVSVFVDDFELLEEKTTSSFYDGTIAVKLRRTRRRV